MPTLYVQEQGALLRKQDQRLVVTKAGQVVQEVPLGKLDQVVLMGRGVQVSTALLVDLLERGIPVLLTNRSGSYVYGGLNAGPSRFGALRLQQMTQTQDAQWALGLAQGIIAAKLANQRALLALTGWGSAAAAMVQIDAAQAGLAQATTLDQVRGYEGAAAAAYFGAWRVQFQRTWGFQGRAFHPPPDPVNAVLSFGYTLLLNDVLTAVQLTGLDPYFGTFHVLDPGRPSLALDVMEPFRPLVVDRLVLDLLIGGSLTRAQFTRPAQPPDAVYLDADGRALLIDRYEHAMQTPIRLANGQQTPMRRVVLLQVQAVARVVRGEQAQYVGFTPA